MYIVPPIKTKKQKQNNNNDNTSSTPNSLCENSSSAVRLEGQRLWKAIFKSCHRFSIGFIGLWASLTQICL